MEESKSGKRVGVNILAYFICREVFVVAIDAALSNIHFCMPEPAVCNSTVQTCYEFNAIHVHQIEYM